MFSPIPEFAIKVTGADYGVIGEGEIILYNLVNALKFGQTGKKVAGMVVRDGENVLFTGKGEYIEKLENLPKIPFELFPTKEWLNIGKWYAENIPDQPHWRHNDKVINIHGGRGCPFNCNFCYHHNKPRYRDVDHMFKDINFALKKYNANMLYFSDDLVIATPKRARKIIESIKNLDKKISYSVSTRFDILERLDDDILLDLKKSGCRIMGLGIESGSDRMLKIIGKNVTSEIILKQLNRLKTVNILPTVSIMVGQYSETEEDVQASIELIKKAVADNYNLQFAFTVTTPFPGSELYNILKKEGKIKSDEDFYRKYFYGSKVGDWNLVVNMSNISTRRVLKLRNQMEEIVKSEKKKVIGVKKYNILIEILKQQKILFTNCITEEELNIRLEELEKQKLELLGILS
jgi:radical SAM superfamily enzyme YgiQ (UPF0313 family)